LALFSTSNVNDTDNLGSISRLKRNLTKK